MKIKSVICSIVLLAWAGGLTRTQAQGNSFTYQGYLTQNGAAYTGNAEFQPTLWSAATGGGQVAANSPATLTAGVTNGLFVLPLDFGANFPGADRWLQLEVRTAIGSFTTLSPRQKVMSAPYAVTAQNVTGSLSASQLTGTVPDARLSANVSLLGQTIVSSEITDGTIVNADISASAAIADTKLATISTAGKVANAATTAASANNANAIAARDASGNFSAGTITAAEFSGGGSSLTSLNASQLTSGTAPDARLSANVSLLGQTIESSEITDGTIVNADISASAAIADTKLATISTAGKVANASTTASSANTANAIVARDASGNFSAGTVSASTLYVDSAAANNRSIYPGLILGGSTSSEAISSRRTSGAGQYGIDFYTANARRMSIANDGKVGIGTDAPQSTLHVVGDAVIQGSLTASNTPGVGYDQHPGSWVTLYDGVRHTIASVTAARPGPGFFVIIGSATFNLDAAELELWDATNPSSPVRLTFASNYSFNGFPNCVDMISLTWVVPIYAASTPQVFELKVGPGSDGYLADNNLTVMYFPRAN